MRRIGSIATALLVLFAGSLAHAQMVADAPLAVNAVTLDGTMGPDEWTDANQYSFDGTDNNTRPGWAECSGDGETPPVAQADWSCTFFVKHDVDWVYICTVVTDDQIQLDTGANQWDDDNMEIYFDTNNSNSAQKEGTVDGFQMSLNADGTIGGGQGYDDWWEGASQVQAPGYIAEFRVSKTQCSMVTGGTYGFDLSPDDDDNGGGRDIQVWWNDTNCDAWDIETNWGDLLLSPDPLVSTPVAPENLTATTGSETVRLDWDSVAAVDGYRLHRRTATTSSTQIAEVASGVTTYLDTGLQNGTTYFYVVTAFRATLESPPSNEVEATPEAGVSLPVRRWHLYR